MHLLADDFQYNCDRHYGLAVDPTSYQSTSGPTRVDPANIKAVIDSRQMEFAGKENPLSHLPYGEA